MGSGKLILTLDPSFRNTGWAVLELADSDESIVDLGCICTKKADKKRKAFAGDDNHQCASHIADELRGLVLKYRPRLICAEAQSGSKNSSAAMLMGMAWGVVSTIATLFEVPVLQVTPVRVKEALTGSAKASKAEIEAAVRQRYPTAEGYMSGLVGGLHEHVWDCLAVAITCYNSTEVRVLRNVFVKERI